jgi:prephenate dehydrogenase
MAALRTLAVVGTGLVGTSIALAARRHGIRVYLLDLDEIVARTAAALGAGYAGAPGEPVDLAVLAVPPSSVATVLAEQQARGLARSYTDVASAKVLVVRQVAAMADASSFVGGHPMAGAERSGPLAARPDLFAGRAWALTPGPTTDQAAYARAEQLATLCDAVPVIMDEADHDEAVALVSHLPHVVASLLAARLLSSPPDANRLAGRGLSDVLRIAGGDAELWSDILRANSAAVVRALEALADDLRVVTDSLRQLATESAGESTTARARLVEMLRRGCAGLSALRGDRAGDMLDLPLDLMISERPGELAELLSVLAELGVGAHCVTISAAATDGVLSVRCVMPAAIAEHFAYRAARHGWRPQIDGVAALKRLEG